MGILKARIESRLARTTDELERVLREEWEALDTDLLSSLSASMPTRCATVAANRGHKVPYPFSAGRILVSHFPL
jgi:uncharacterized membrane-anchored protein